MGLTKGSLISHNMPRDTVTMFPGDAKAQQAADSAAQKAAAEARARCQQNPSEEDVALQAAVNGDLSLIINLFRKRKIDGPAREELIVKNEKLIERIEKLEAEAFTYQTQISAMDGQLLRAEKLVERTNQLEAEHVARFSNEPPAHLEADGLTRQQIAELLIANRTLTRSVQSYANEVEQYKKVIARLQPENYKVQEEAAFLGKRVKCYKAVYPEFNVDAAVAQLDAAPSSTPPSTGAVMQSAQAIGVQVSDAKGVFTSPPTVESKPNGGGGGGDDPFGVRTDLQLHDASQEMPPADSTPSPPAEPTPAPPAVSSGGAPYEEFECDEGVLTWLEQTWSPDPSHWSVFAKLKQDEKAIHSGDALRKVRQGQYTWELCMAHTSKQRAYANFHLDKVLDEEQKDGVNCVDWIIEKSESIECLTGFESLSRANFADGTVLQPGKHGSSKEPFKIDFAQIETIKFRSVPLSRVVR